MFNLLADFLLFSVNESYREEDMLFLFDPEGCLFGVIINYIRMLSSSFRCYFRIYPLDNIVRLSYLCL